MSNIIKTKKQGLLIVISGPSGCGKDTIVNEVLNKRDNCWLSISCTTRNPRQGEKDSQDYYFLSTEEFEKAIKDNNFLEYAIYNDNYYGTPLNYIKDHLNNGEDVILVIEIQGALKIKEKLEDTVFIFIMPPSMKELKKRLVNRNTDSPDKIDKRFKRAYEEINELTKYNYVVVNDEIITAANKINAILEAEKCRVDRIEEVFLDTSEEQVHETLLHDVKEFDNSLIDLDKKNTNE